MSGRFLSLMCFAWHHIRRVGHCRWGIFIVTVHKRRFICAVSKEKEDSCFALQQHLSSSLARCGGWFMHFSLGKWAENGCTLFSENSKSRFFPSSCLKRAVERIDSIWLINRDALAPRSCFAEQRSSNTPQPYSCFDWSHLDDTEGLGMGGGGPLPPHVIWCMQALLDQPSGFYIPELSSIAIQQQDTDEAAIVPGGREKSSGSKYCSSSPDVSLCNGQ